MAERPMIEIASTHLSAAINPFGAELTHLRDADGRELMTDGDPAFWTGHAPLLFPFVGALNGGTYRVDGQDYALPQHGFARRQLFEPLEQAPGRTVLRLADTAETRAVYPFAFTLDAAYALDGATLAIDVTVTNRDTRAMPASFGFHPAFAWPLPYGAPREDHRITFAADEPAAIRRIVDGGLIGTERRPSPLDGRELLLRDDLFADNALIWDAVESRSVRYGATQGPALEIAFPDTSMLGIWSKPGARFVCIEPWHGIADPEGFAGEVWNKPGVLRLEPGEARTFAMRVTLAV